MQTDTGSGDAILRSVDPQDKLVYVWSTFEPDGARRAWACFDQPDLKAVHAFQVSAPQEWTVLSNSAPEVVVDRDDGGRLWIFEDTPRLSTYVVVVNAGPFHEIRQERGGFSLGLYCRQSLRPYLERDAEELFLLTEQGLAFFGEQFAQPFAQQRYDQVFVPDFGGAMENWGCITWTDSVLWRTPPTFAQREMVAIILLHEMAHQWFGDLVTMRWWDDLWLNEAFASFASVWAAVSATEFTDSWATFLAGEQLLAYRQDMGPASHAIRGPVPDVEHAFASFDAITYYKGQAALHQLMQYVGEEAFVEGLRRYFAEHAWGNARLADLMTRDRRRRRPRPGRVDHRLARPARHRHHQPGRHHAAHLQPRRRRAAAARAPDRLLRAEPRRRSSGSASSGSRRPAPRRTSPTCRTPTCTCSTRAT